MKSRLQLMSGAAMAVLSLAAGAARAQDGSGGKAIQDVVITATHTGATNLQKTPLTVNVVSGNDLKRDQLTTFTELAQSVPSLQIKQDYGNPTVYIRGVGGNNGNADDNDVAIYLDGVYLSRPLIVMNSNFNDLDRVEVVEGPQGTLFGRNSAGGAVNFISRQAPDHFEFQNTLSVGNFALIDEAATIGGPLADNIQARLSFSHVQHSGYLHNVNPGVGDPDAANRTGVRGQVRWEITPDITDIVRADFIDTDEAWQQNDALQSPPAYSDPLAVSIIGKLDKVDMNVLPHLTELGYGVSNELNWKFNDNLSLKSLTALRTQTVKTSFGGANTDRVNGATSTSVNGGSNTPTGEYAVTQEFNLINHYGALSGVIGYFYFDEHYKFNAWGTFNLATLPTYFPGQYFQITKMPTTSQAVFFNETYQFTPTVGVTLGARYTVEHKSLTNEISEFDVGFNSLAQALAGDPALAACVAANKACGGNYVGDLNKNYSGFTPKIAVNWQATPDSLLYVSATEAYKSGGFNTSYVPGPGVVPDFGPETIWAYEIGSKNDLFDHTLRVNMALFYYDWTGLQFNSLIAPAVSVVSNAGNANELGFELNVLSKPAKGWTFTAGLTALSSRYASFPKFSPNNALIPYLVSSPKYNPASNTVDAAGNELAGAPPINVILTGQKDFDLADGADLYIRALYEYQAKTYMEPANAPIAIRPAVSLINASIGYTPARSHWTVALWGKNLTNQIFTTGLGGGNPLGLRVSDPRTYGLQINYTY